MQTEKTGQRIVKYSGPQVRAYGFTVTRARLQVVAGGKTEKLHQSNQKGPFMPWSTAHEALVKC